MARTYADRDLVESHPVAAERTADGLNTLARFAGVVAGAVPTIIGLIALVQMDWSAGLDAPPVDVAGMTFRPWIAIATTVLGIFALAAAASWDRESKLFTGGILVAIGIVILIANPTIEAVALTSRMGWMAVIVGGILAAVGLIAGQTWSSRRARVVEY